MLLHVRGIAQVLGCFSGKPKKVVARQITAVLVAGDGWEIGWNVHGGTGLKIAVASSTSSNIAV